MARQSASRSHSAGLELAHVLFLDLVGYSRLSIEEQTQRIGQLQLIVRGIEAFRRGEAEDDLLCLPTGDGMALVYFRDPVAPARCARELDRALRHFPELKVRMGVHTGPVHRIEDINANRNVAGGGINIAQRVMDCGDAGHILASGTVAEVLRQLRDWAEALHDLGECEVKHGERVRLYNLYTEAFGNPRPPTKLRPVASASPSSTGGPRTEVRQPAVSAPITPRVAVLYKRNAQPDGQVLAVLEARLHDAGYGVFLDRHLTIGVEWAVEIERQLRSADAVIPLLSAASVHSEMLQHELQVAHEAAQQSGKPRLLPVRLRYSDPLPEPLAAILGPLHHAAWDGPEDDERLAAALIHALESPADSRTAVAPLGLEPVGGAVPLDSQFYVVRPVDDLFRTAIARRDSIVLVKGARQMGKTSLLARGLQQAREAGARVITTDFQMLNAAQLQSADTLLLTLAEWIADQLDLDVSPQADWKSSRGPSMNFRRYLQREVLGKGDTSVVWGLDEVDRLFAYPFASEVFGMFRSWHNARSLDPAAPWSRLTLAIAYALEAHLFITDMNQSPFNVGTRLILDDFAPAEVADLNARHGEPLRDSRELDLYYRLVGGHPYLARRGLLEMAAQGLSISELEAVADRDEGIFGDHLKRLLAVLAQDSRLLDAAREVLHRSAAPSYDSFSRLRSAGVVAGETPQEARLRCQLYATYLERHLG